MLSVGDCIPDYVLKKHLQSNTVKGKVACHAQHTKVSQENEAVSLEKVIYGR